MASDGFIFQSADARRIAAVTKFAESHLRRFEGQLGGGPCFDSSDGFPPQFVMFKGTSIPLAGTALLWILVDASQAGTVTAGFNAGPPVISSPGLQWWRLTNDFCGQVYVYID